MGFGAGASVSTICLIWASKAMGQADRPPTTNRDYESARSDQLRRPPVRPPTPSGRELQRAAVHACPSVGLEPGRKFPLPLGSLFVYYIFVQGTTKKTNSNKPGRRATGQDPVTSLRMPIALKSKIRAWASKRHLTVSKAICRLTEQALQAEGEL